MSKEKDHKVSCKAPQDLVEIYDEEFDEKDPLDLSKQTVFCKMRCTKCLEVYLKKIPLYDFNE